MTDIMMGHTGHGIWLILMLSMPAVLLAAGIGLVVGILQAVTQVQEQTIAAAPKLVFVFLLVIFGGPLMIEILKDFTAESVHIGMEIVPKEEKMILPPKPRLAYGEENSRFDFFKEPHRYRGQNKVKQMIDQAPRLDMMKDPEPNVRVRSLRPLPKPGPGESIYLKRRDTGTLPLPPDRRSR